MSTPAGPEPFGPPRAWDVRRPPPPAPGSVPTGVPEAIDFRFDRVREVGSQHGVEGAGDLGLVLDGRGVEVTGRVPDQRQLLVWTAVTRVSLGLARIDPGGGFVTPLEIESLGGVRRFLIPSAHPRPVRIEALDGQLARWSRSGTGDLARPPAWSRPYPGVPGAMPPVFDGRPSGTGRPHRRRPKRVRRTRTLVMAIGLLLAGTGLAIGLSSAGTGPRLAGLAAPRLSPDQQLANQLMLTRSDLPHGWTVATDNGGSGTSQQVQRAQAAITATFARCMGITDQQGAIVLGGQAADQTAQTSSPIFVAPNSAAQPGFSVELQTAAAIVRTPGDERNDFSLYAIPQYPQCAATAVASELQAGANSASGQNRQPGPATASAVALPAPAGEQLAGVVATFTVTDGPAPVPVEVEAVSVGTNRIEASLQAFAIGGRIPPDVLAASVAAFEQRVASEGKSTLV